MKFLIGRKFCQPVFLPVMWWTWKGPSVILPGLTAGKHLSLISRTPHIWIPPATAPGAISWIIAGLILLTMTTIPQSTRAWGLSGLWRAHLFMILSEEERG